MANIKFERHFISYRILTIVFSFQPRLLGCLPEKWNRFYTPKIKKLEVFISILRYFEGIKQKSVVHVFGFHSLWFHFGSYNPWLLPLISLFILFLFSYCNHWLFRYSFAILSFFPVFLSVFSRYTLLFWTGRLWRQIIWRQWVMTSN